MNNTYQSVISVRGAMPVIVWSKTVRGYAFKRWHFVIHHALFAAFFLSLLFMAPATHAQNKASLEGLKAIDRVYDGTTNVDFTGHLRLTGVHADHDVSLIGDASSVTGFIESADVGFGKVVSVDLSGLALGGKDGGSYILDGTVGDVVVTIHTRPIRLAGLVARDKVFDGNDQASIDDAMLQPDPRDKIGGDDVDVLGTANTGRFEHAGPGINIPVEINFSASNGLRLTGKHAGNYVLARDGEGHPVSSKPLHARITRD